MSEGVIQLPRRGELKECGICRKPIAGRPDEIRQGETAENSQLLGYAHPVCIRDAHIAELQGAVANVRHLVATILEAVGPVRITEEQGARAMKNGARYDVTKQPDGSWKVEKPSLIVDPRGEVLPPPPKESA